MEENRSNRDLLNELGYEDVVVFENPDYDSAIIGVSEGRRAVYDFDKMVKHLVENDGMTEEEAIEFIEYNTIRALPYFANSPIIMYPIEQYQ